MRSCLRQDSAQPDLSFLKGSYLQPELKADRHVWPDSMSEMEKEALEQSVEQLEGTTEKIEEKEVAPPVQESELLGKNPEEEAGQKEEAATPPEEDAEETRQDEGSYFGSYLGSVIGSVFGSTKESPDESAKTPDEEVGHKEESTTPPKAGKKPDP